MFCQNCGAQVAEGSAFCTSCGAALNAASAQAQPTPEVQETPQAQPTPEAQAAPQAPESAQPTYEQPAPAQAPQGTYQPYGTQPEYQQPVYQQPPVQQPPYQQSYQAPYGQMPVMPMQPNPSPSFGDCIKLFFKNYVNFSGRSRRTEYWYCVLFQMIVSIVLSILGSIITSITDGGTVGVVISSVLTYGWSLACFIPALALLIRRLHDIGKSGWYVLFSLIPLVGSIILIVWAAQDSVPEPNEYGVSPKYTPGFTYEQAQPQAGQPQPPVPPYM